MNYEFFLDYFSFGFFKSRYALTKLFIKKSADLFEAVIQCKGIFNS